MDRFHSVILDEQACKGCTICVTGCPTEAIRVRDGKARITSERCIDCGECIRRCPHRAKKPKADSFTAFPAAWRDRFDLLVALPAPSLYGQFPPKYAIADIHEGLKALGFDEVFPVAAATPAISAATRALIDERAQRKDAGPLISSSCPTIVKYVQIRYPTLLENLAGVIAPMELAGRLVKRSFPGRVGCFFISPCAGKITEAAAPIGGGLSSVDAVFPMNDIHLSLLQAIIRNAKEEPAEPGAGRVSAILPTAAEISWGRSGGESDTALGSDSSRALSVDGMDQCVRILEAAEDGKLIGIDFLELMACPGGCTGGPLTACNTALARHHLRERERTDLSARLQRGGQEAVNRSETGTIAALAEEERTACYRPLPFPARPALRLNPDIKVAMAMMQRIDEIGSSLPGLDCGCCGAPNCQALAEDIVRGTASKSDCVIIMKEEYRELLEQRWQSME